MTKHLFINTAQFFFLESIWYHISENFSKSVHKLYPLYVQETLYIRKHHLLIDQAQHNEQAVNKWWDSFCLYPLLTGGRATWPHPPSWMPSACGQWDLFSDKFSLETTNQSLKTESILLQIITASLWWSALHVINTMNYEKCMPFRKMDLSDHYTLKIKHSFIQTKWRWQYTRPQLIKAKGKTIRSIRNASHN